MYVIIEDGGKQYKVSNGETIDFEKKPLAVGMKVEFDKVLLCADDTDILIGAPYVQNCKVMGTVVGQVKGPKLVIMKVRKKKASKTKTGHRQKYTRIKIEEIQKT